MDKKYAIIDIGSNTMRLIVYLHGKNGSLTKLEDLKIASRLRSYISNDGNLNQEGTTQLLQTLKKFQKITRCYQLDEVACIATAALRNTGNQKSLSELVSHQTDFTIQILSDYEEAYYGYLAAVNSLPYSNGLTIDVGGGSTEITYFEEKELVHYHSFPFGALSLKQSFIGEDHLKDEKYRAINDFVRKQLDSLEWLKKYEVPLIGLGGNAHNIVRVHQKRNGYPSKKLHGCKITADDIQEVFAYLQPISFRELKNIDGLSKKRADIILPVLCVFQCLLDKLGSSQFILSRKGLRDGLLQQVIKQGGDDSIDV